MNEFWKSTASSEGGPLSESALTDAWTAALRTQRRPPAIVTSRGVIEKGRQAGRDAWTAYDRARGEAARLPRWRWIRRRRALERAVAHAADARSLERMFGR